MATGVAGLRRADLSCRALDSSLKIFRGIKGFRDLVGSAVDTLSKLERSGGHPMSNPVRIALVVILIVILYYLVVTLGRSVAG